MLLLDRILKACLYIPFHGIERVGNYCGAGVLLDEQTPFSPDGRL